jgi:hypothetical protein
MRLIVLLLAGAALSGCIPYRYTNRPGVVGTVVGARTQRPIPGAGVSLDGPGGPISTVTAADGSFAIAPLRQWGIYIVPMDIWDSSYPLSVVHSGFQPYSREVRSNPAIGGAEATKNLGVVALQPLR